MKAAESSLVVSLLCLLLVATAPLAGVLAVAPNGCDETAPRSLNGTCITLTGNPDMGAAGMPFTFECGQHYPKGDGMFYFDKQQRDMSTENEYAMELDDNEDSTATICSPETCTEVGIATYYKGIGSNLFGANPRQLSNALHKVYQRKKTKVNEKHSMFITFFGQFLVHDVFGETERTSIMLDKGGFPDMNDPGNPFVLTGIPLERNDDFVKSVPNLDNVLFPVMGVSGPRTKPIRNRNGAIKGMEFYNARTDLVDLDGIYGVGGEISNCIRTFHGGLLKLQDYDVEVPLGPGQTANIHLSRLPPPTTCLSDEVRESLRGEIHPNTEDVTPLFGDLRNTENVAMGVIHLAFVRYHNYLAFNFCNSDNDEDKFQCARRLNIATYQHIVYEEYMTALTGRNLLSGYDGYNPDTDYTLMAEADICARLHFGVPHELPLKNTRCQLETAYDAPPIHGLESLGDPEPGHIPAAGVRFNQMPMGAFPVILGLPAYFTGQDPFQQLLQGMSCTSVPRFNEQVDSIIRNQPAPPGGFDIPAFTYKRIEQLGIASYINVHEQFLGPGLIYGKGGCVNELRYNHNVADPLVCFENMTGGNSALAQKLMDRMDKAGLFPKITNIPLWTGIAYEKKKRQRGNGAKSLLGRTQDAVLREQLRRARDGDRFFYLHELNNEEIRQVKQVKLAHVLKQAFGSRVKIPDEVFYTRGADLPQ